MLFLEQSLGILGNKCAESIMLLHARDLSLDVQSPPCFDNGRTRLNLPVEVVFRRYPIYPIIRLLPWVLVSLGLAVGSIPSNIAAAALPHGGAIPTVTVVTCTNLASGVTWRVTIDFVRHTVDSNPARFSSRDISWHDANDGGNYNLDRSSGRLTVIFASSTGGYFIHDRCNLEK
jgi:hypothetical protein